MLSYLRSHWVAVILVAAVALATVLNFQQARQVEKNRQANVKTQQVFNEATCAIRDTANKQLDAINKMRVAVDAALDVAAANSRTAAAKQDFTSLSQDVSAISIDHVAVPPDTSCN